MSTSDLLARALIFRERLLDLEDLVQQSLQHENAVEEVLSMDPGSPYATCYKYNSLLVSQPLLLYWRIVIIINSTIQRLALQTSRCPVSTQELDASSVCAAHHIARSAEDGRRSTPIASMIQIFNLPAAIWAFSFSRSQEVSSGREARWLSVLMEEYIQLLDSMMKALIEKYLEAVGLAFGNALTMSPDDPTASDTMWSSPDAYISGDEQSAST